MLQDLTNDQSSLVEVNGLVLSGNKPLPQPMLTQLLWHHLASLGVNELSNFIPFVQTYQFDINGLAQDCSISSALAMEILHSCLNPSVLLLCSLTHMWYIIDSTCSQQIDFIFHNLCILSHFFTPCRGVIYVTLYYLLLYILCYEGPLLFQGATTGRKGFI